MEPSRNNAVTVSFRPYTEADFADIQQLNAEEGWTNLAAHEEQTREAWRHSDVTCVATSQGAVVGYIRGLTDQHVTLYVCEFLIKDGFRGQGVGRRLLRLVHGLYPTTRIELLASSSSCAYYEHLGLRDFPGFRATIAEYQP